jgi:hypothetical protein
MNHIRKIMKVLRDEDNDFRMSHVQDMDKGIILGFCGERDGGNLICLNIIDIVMPTLVHELLHAAYPDWSEKKVERETDKFVYRLTRRQRRDIFARWMGRISEVEVETN